MAESIEIVEIMCHDCGSDSQFEVVAVVDTEGAREWACLSCGAAYIEAFDNAIEVGLEVRGVA